MASITAKARIIAALLLISVFGICTGQIAVAGTDRDIDRYAPEAMENLYRMWWRPYRIIPNKNTVESIRKQVASIKKGQEQSINIKKVFKDNHTSSFLYYVLAGSKEAGGIILQNMLKEYARKDLLDDRWLLIVSALGRSSSSSAGKVLTAELDRVTKKYKFGQDDKSDAIPKADVRPALIDAIVAWKAENGGIAVKDIQGLCKSAPDLAMNTWMFALEWAQRLSTEKTFIAFLKQVIEGCDDKDLKQTLEFSDDGSSDRLASTLRVVYLCEQIWPAAKELVVSYDGSRATLKDFYVALLSSIYLFEADRNFAKYTVNDKEISFLEKNIASKSRLLSRNAFMLKELVPSKKDARLDKFLSSQVSKFKNADDIEMAKGWLKSIVSHETSKSRAASLKKLKSAAETKPGVYMLGFKAVGGFDRMPKTIRKR